MHKRLTSPFDHFKKGTKLGLEAVNIGYFLNTIKK